MSNEEMGAFLRRISDGGEWSIEMKRVSSGRYLAHAVRWPDVCGLDYVVSRGTTVWENLEELAVKIAAREQQDRRGK